MNDREEVFEHRIRIMRPDEASEYGNVRLPQNSSPRFYAALRQVVEPIVGSPIEHVRVYCDFDGDGAMSYRDMFVHELGHLNGLARNELATHCYRNNVLVHEIAPPPPEHLPWIAGSACLFQKRVWF